MKYDIEVIHHARKSLLFNESHTWIKKEGDLFDLTRSFYDGAEVCKLVGSYLLNLLSPKYVKGDFGIYHDDGLAFIKRKLERNQNS